ncbi:MAG: protease modulator HflC [Proteobacteria bacterium]|nr:protease modulator HflC [Pseudomonadota bacterium]
MMNKVLALLVIVALSALGLYNSAFVVTEREQVVITQMGKPVRDPIITPGIHFKVPFIEHANYFDKRFLEWDGSPNQIQTKEKRFIWVDTYARWRIKDPLLFFQRVRDERGAQSRLDDILDGETRNAIAKHDLVEIVRSTNRESAIADEVGLKDGSGALQTIKYGRDKITKEILTAAAPRTLELGIELLDIRLKRINYVQEVQRKIFERMITERKRIADKFRSEGQGAASKILGDKGRELKKIESEAYRIAQELKGKADAEASSIYAKAYNQNRDSREFYAFIKTMESYKSTLSEKDWLVLSTKSDYFKYLQKQSSK